MRTQRVVDERAFRHWPHYHRALSPSTGCIFSELGVRVDASGHWRYFGAANLSRALQFSRRICLAVLQLRLLFEAESLLQLADDLEVGLAIIWLIQDVKLFSNQPDATEAICTVGAGLRAQKVMTFNTAHTIDQMAALMAVITPLDVTAISAPNGVLRVLAAVTVFTVFTEHALSTVLTSLRVEAVWVATAR